MTLHRCPDCHCSADEPIPQPSTSSPGIRRLALQRTEEAVRRAKDSRKKPAEETR